MQLKLFSNYVLVCIIIISLTSQNKTISAANIFLIFKKIAIHF